MCSQNHSVLAFPGARQSRALSSFCDLHTVGSLSHFFSWPEIVKADILEKATRCLSIYLSKHQDHKYDILYKFTRTAVCLAHKRLKPLTKLEGDHSLRRDTLNMLAPQLHTAQVMHIRAERAGSPQTELPCP
eukprot:5663725-Amphidinium_carterae.1